MARRFSNKCIRFAAILVLTFVGMGTCLLSFCKLQGQRDDLATDRRLSTGVLLAEKIKARAATRARSFSGGGFERVRRVSAAGDADSAEHVLARKMRLDLDGGDWQAAREKARELLLSKDKVVQEEVRTTLLWIGEKALPELLELAVLHESEDEDPIIDLQHLINGIPQENRQAEAIVAAALCLSEVPHIEGMLMELASLSDEIKFGALIRIIKEADGTVAGECAREMYEHFSGGEAYGSKS